MMAEPSRWTLTGWQPCNALVIDDFRHCSVLTSKCIAALKWGEEKMPNTDELPDADLDDKCRELLTAISLEPVSPKLLDLAKQLGKLLDLQAENISRSD
ncbi:MAG: hypothetical protein H7317_06290 [Pseudorhodobacter sp.]|nr:hypothetical protein [Pseudorhodobacter sp.]